MISLSTAFTIHGVVSVLFCLPVLGGMAAFIKVITNEELTSPDKFHMNVYSIDFAKNVMITLQCYAGTKMDGAAQKLLAQTFVAMCLMCVAVLFIDGADPGAHPAAALPHDRAVDLRPRHDERQGQGGVGGAAEPGYSTPTFLQNSFLIREISTDPARAPRRSRARRCAGAPPSARG